MQVLGTVGEPINPAAWRWYNEVVGEGRCPVVDTWWQTETGGAMLTPLPGAWAEKAGSVALPFFGAAPAVLDPESGEELHGPAEGVLCFNQVRPPACKICLYACAQRRSCLPPCGALCACSWHMCAPHTHATARRRGPR